MIVCWTPSKTVTVVVLSMVMQLVHFEGGFDNVMDGVSSDTGSKALQDIVACRSPQKAQKLGLALLTTNGFPRCVDLSRADEGLQMGSQSRIELRRLSFSDVYTIVQ